MKKLLALVLALALTFVLASCGEKKTNSDTTNNGEAQNNNEAVETAVFENPDLLALADSLYSDFAADELPMLSSMEVFPEDFEFFTFIPYEEGFKAVVSEPMTGSIAHSVVLVETPDAETAKTVAENMKANANPRKWICVEAEKVESATNKNIAILVMSDSKTDKIIEKFLAVTSETMPVMTETDVEEAVEEEIEEVTDDVVEEETEADVEATPETEDVPATMPEEPVADVPATMPEEPAADVPATMPEVEDVPAVTPEVEEVPAVTPEVEDVPAVMPEVEDVPATMPEVEDVPATMPEVEDVPATMPEEPVVEETPEVEAPAADNGSIDDLYAIADKLYNGIDPYDMPMVGTMELNEEIFEYSAFVPYKASYLAVESMPMTGSQPHSVVIVKASSAEEAAQLANDMKANANPRKWMCVSARSVKSASKGQYAILVMTSYEVMPNDEIDEEKAEEMSNEKSEERANIIINNFLAAV